MNFLTDSDLLKIASCDYDPRQGFNALMKELHDLDLEGSRYQMEDVILNVDEARLLTSKGPRMIYTQERVRLFNVYREQMYRNNYLLTVWNILSFWQLSQSDVQNLIHQDVNNYIASLRKYGVYIALPKQKKYDKDFLKLMTCEIASARERFYVETSRVQIA